MAAGHDGKQRAMKVTTPKETRSNPAVGPFADSTGSPAADSMQALRKRAEALEAERTAETAEDPEDLSPEAGPPAATLRRFAVAYFTQD